MFGSPNMLHKRDKSRESKNQKSDLINKVPLTNEGVVTLGHLTSQ